MTLLSRLRFTLADGAMLVAAAAAASALFAKVHELAGTPPFWSSWKVDAPSLLVLAIALTAVALGSSRRHSASQILLQVTLACLGLLSLLWLVEAEWHRAALYWFQAAFALTVAGPMIARRLVKGAMPRGPRRAWWEATLEASAFSFLNLLLVVAGAIFQFSVAQLGDLVLLGL